MWDMQSRLVHLGLLPEQIRLIKTGHEIPHVNAKTLAKIGLRSSTILHINKRPRPKQSAAAGCRGEMVPAFRDVVVGWYHKYYRLAMLANMRGFHSRLPWRQVPVG